MLPGSSVGTDNPAMGLMVALAFAIMTAQGDCKPQFAPLDTGTTSGNSKLPFWSKQQAGGWGGDGWLGWTWNSRTLQPVRLIVRPRPKDQAQDDDEVTVQSVPDVTFAVRCIPGLRAGGIRAADVVNHELNYRGPLSISLGERRYQLRLQTVREDLSDAKVILTDGKRTQVLYSADGFVDDPHFEIEWAGDLDRDGKLDLIVNLSRKYSVHPHRLLLSSRASGTQLVGEAAVFETGD